MPELPEIEVLRRDLEKEVVGRRFKEVEIRPSRNAMKIVTHHARRKDFHDLLTGAKVERIDRAGKRLLLSLDNGQTIVIHLGTTGQLLKTSASEEIASHTHLIFSFTIGGQLRVIDPGLTAEIFSIPKDDLKALDEVASTALDPLTGASPLTWHHFSALLDDRAKELKTLFLDDGFVVGLGNLYTDEILWGAALRFDRRSDHLSSQDVRRLYRGLVETLQDAVRARGTSIDGYPFTDLAGQEGTYGLELKVYAREGAACRRCRHEIAKTEWNGLDTYFCPQCQS